MRIRTPHQPLILTPTTPQPTARNPTRPTRTRIPTRSIITGLSCRSGTLGAVSRRPHPDPRYSHQVRNARPRKVPSTPLRHQQKSLNHPLQVEENGRNMRLRPLHFQIPAAFLAVSENQHNESKTTKSPKTRRSRFRRQRSPRHRQLRSLHATIGFRHTLCETLRQDPPVPQRIHHHIHHDPRRMRPLWYFPLHRHPPPRPHVFSSRRRTRPQFYMAQDEQIKQTLHHQIPTQAQIEPPEQIRTPRSKRPHVRYSRQSAGLVPGNLRTPARPRTQPPIPKPR